MQDSWRQAERHARVFQRPSSNPVSTVSNGDASNVEVCRANGHDISQPAQLSDRGVPDNDNQTEGVTRSECDAGAGAAKAQEQITEDNLVSLLAAKKLYGNGPPEQYLGTAQIEAANANTPSLRPHRFISNVREHPGGA